MRQLVKMIRGGESVEGGDETLVGRIEPTRPEIFEQVDRSAAVGAAAADQIVEDSQFLGGMTLHQLVECETILWKELAEHVDVGHFAEPARRERGLEFVHGAAFIGAAFWPGRPPGGQG